MKVAQDNGLVFNSEKCAIGREKIHFFGMVYVAKGGHPILKEWKTSEIHQLRQTRHVCNGSWG